MAYNFGRNDGLKKSDLPLKKPYLRVSDKGRGFVIKPILMPVLLILLF